MDLPLARGLAASAALLSRLPEATPGGAWANRGGAKHAIGAARSALETAERGLTQVARSEDM